MSAPVIGAALKWAPLHVTIEPLTGVPAPDRVAHGLSAADRAALEVALRLAGRFQGVVRAATVGPAVAEAALREAFALGAAEGVHVLVDDDRLLPGSPESCARTAAGLASAFRGCAFVVCGDYSPDGGTGAVPGLLAATVGVAQALGLVGVDVDGQGDTIECERRLDRGRRERLRVTAPAVLSVEPSTVRPRRGALPAVIAAGTRPVEIVHLPAAEPSRGEMAYAPYRPRTRVVPAPDEGLSPDDRIRAILGIGTDREPPRAVRAEPEEAAREIAHQLRRWGYG